MSLILAPERQMQEDLCEFEVSLVYIVNSRIAKITKRDLISKNQPTPPPPPKKNPINEKPDH